MHQLLSHVRSTGRIGPDEVRAVRCVMYPDGVVQPAEIDVLFEIDEAASERDRLWRELFCEAVADYLVRQESPQGYVSTENADWLTARIAKDGVVKTETELEALIHVLEQAESAPATLAAFALAQVREAVLQGEGPLKCGRTLTPGHIGQPEVSLIRRILYAYGGGGGLSVTRPEAEVLFDINDAVAGREPHPAWSDLFVKALANFTMAASGYTAPPRHAALAREAWLESESDGIGGFFRKMTAGGVAGVLEAYRDPPMEDVWAERNAAFDANAAANAPVTETEAEWLAARIGRDGELHENERALLRFIRDESPAVHDALKPLIDAA